MSDPHNVDLNDSDPSTIEFWRGCEARRLLLQYSPSRDRYQFYPRPVLAGDGATDLEWRQSAGRGRVHAMAVIRVDLVPDWPAPYVVALVELDEGPIMMTNIITQDGALPIVKVGDRVRLAWRERTGRPPLPVFMPD